MNPDFDPNIPSPALHLSSSAAFPPVVAVRRCAPSHAIAAPADRYTIAAALANATKRAPHDLAHLDSLLFDGQEGSMASFLRRLCERPITIGSAQLKFYRAMEEHGCFQPAEVRSSYSAPSVMQLHIVHIEDPDGRLGTYSFDLVTFIVNFAAFLVSNSHQARVKSLLQIPCEIAKTFLLFVTSEYSCSFPTRRWFVQRFFRPDCADFNCWLQSNNMTSLLRNEQFIDLMFLSSQQRQMEIDKLPIDCRQTLSDAHVASPMVSAPREFRESFSIRHLAAARNPATIMTFFTLFITRMMEGLPNIMLFASTADGINKARQLFELAYAMLLGWSLGDIEITAAQLPEDLLRLMDSAVEEMRCHLDTSSRFTPSQNSFINRIVVSSEEFARRWFNELEIRRAVTEDACSRKKLVVNYVDTDEELFTTFVADIYNNKSCVQLRMLNLWLSELPENMRPDISTVLSTEAATSGYRAGINSFFTVLRLPASSHLHKMQWTLAFFERIGRIFPAKLHALTSTDARGPYIVMPRQIMNILRVVMAGDALTSPNYPKAVAAWPLLALFWVSKRVDRDDAIARTCLLDSPMDHVSIDQVSASTVLAVLSHWLYVPLLTKKSQKHASGNSDRVGVPTMGSSSFEFVRLVLHRIVDSLFGHIGLEEDIDMMAHMPELNAVRSFIMLNAPHYLSYNSLDRIIGILRVKATNQHEYDLLEVLLAIRDVNSPASASACRKRGAHSAGLENAAAEPEFQAEAEASYPKPPAATKRSRGRPSLASKGKEAVEPRGHYISLAVVNGINAEEIKERISESNLFLLASSEAERTTMINHWIYEVIADHGDRTLLMDFLVHADIQITKVSFNKPIYVCSPNAVHAWSSATEYVAHHLSGDSSAFQRHRYQLREEYAPEGGKQRYHQLVMFMRRLEAHVCMIPAAASSSSSSSSSAAASAASATAARRGNKPAAVKAMPNVPEPTTAREAQLVRCLEDFYSKKPFSHPVPTAACFSGGQFVMLPFDRALTMVGVVPWHRGAAGASPTNASALLDDDSMLPANDASAENSLSSVSIGNAALLCGTLNEFKVAHKAEPHGVFKTLMARKAQTKKSPHHYQPDPPPQRPYQGNGGFSGAGGGAGGGGSLVR